VYGEIIVKRRFLARGSHVCVCVKTFPQNQYHTMIPTCTQETLVLYLL